MEACPVSSADLQVGLVAPAELRDQPDLLALAAERGVTLFLQDPERGFARRAGPMISWLQVKRLVPVYKPTRVMFLHGDSILNTALPLQLPLGCSVSAIVFGSTVHYAACGFTQLTPAEVVRAKRQRLALFLAEQHPDLAELFWLDPYGAEYMSSARRFRGWRGKGNACRHRWLPDPLSAAIVPAECAAERRRLLGIAEGRQVFLLFGPPNPRKGVEQALEAFLLLPNEVLSKVNVLLVGKATAQRKQLLDPLVSAVKAHLSGALQWVDSTVPEAQVPEYFALADVVMVPYQRHVGSSGVLIRAAHAGKPVIASDYGLVGEWTRRHQLGAAVNCELPAELLRSIMAAIERGVPGYDPAATALFAQAFTKSEFTRLLLEQA
jgi:glycosyltransferase involved in cell wall biosynthesis